MEFNTPGKRLQAARRAAGLHVSQVADALGVAESTVRANENGQNGIRPAVAELYAAVLGVDAGYILFGTGDAPVPTGPPPPVGKPSPYAIAANPRDPSRAIVKIDAEVPFDVGLEIIRMVREATKPSGG